MQTAASQRYGGGDDHYTPAATAATGPNTATFGELIQVNSGEEFLAQVDKEHSAVTVVVHLYDSAVPSCRLLNEHLAILAQQWRDVKFLCMPAALSGVHIDPVALPALSLY
ncbi:unnamed protein product, partial [Symbiodinium microadriaticum]